LTIRSGSTPPRADDLLERRAKQVVLAIVARLAHRSPRQRISPSKESRTAQIGNLKPQENSHAHPAFLQNRLLAQIKSSRSIKRFRILHGGLFTVLVRNHMRTDEEIARFCAEHGVTDSDLLIAQILVPFETRPGETAKDAYEREVARHGEKR
jgi:hypothetical protein